MSSATTSAPIFPPYIATGRFANNSDDDHAGAIWIVTLLCLVYSSMVVTIRGYLRWKVLGLDDYVILFATTGEVAALIIALQHGLGQSHVLLTAEQISKANKATFIGIILFIASTCVAKISVILLMMRLFNLSGPRAAIDSRTRALWTTCVTVMVLTVLWWIGSTIGLSTNCTTTNLTTIQGRTQCPDQTFSWGIITSVDVLTELALIIFSIVIVWPVQLTLSLKIPIILAFSFRLPCAILSIIHLHFIQHQPPTQPGLRIVPSIVLMQTQLCWSLISATIPTLSSFVRSFNSTFIIGLDPSKSRTSSRSTRHNTTTTATTINTCHEPSPHRHSSTATTLTPNKLTKETNLSTTTTTTTTSKRFNTSSLHAYIH